jgi:hypothetical protein
VNAQEAVNLVGATQRLWPNAFTGQRDLRETAKLWQLVLIDVSYEDAIAALVACARRGDEFAPQPGMLVKQHHDLHDQRAPTADEAWAEVQRAIARLGFYIGPPDQWSHTAVASCADAIGWRELCHGDAMVTRAHFLKLYPAALERTERDRTQAHTDNALNAMRPPAIGGVVRELSE